MLQKLKIFNNSHIFIYPKKIGHVANQSPDFLRCGVNTVIAYIGLTPRGLEECRNDPHGCRFAAVRTYETEKVTCVQVEVNALDCEGITILLR